MKVTQEQFKTVKDQLVVLIPELKKETDGGVIIPDNVLMERMKERGLNAFLEVIETGDEVRSVMVGDFVLVTRVTDVPVDATNPEFKVGVAREYDVVGYYTKDK